MIDLTAPHKHPFTGRGAEIEIVRTRLTMLKQGSGGRLGLEAESGMGKTHLLDEIARLATEDGMTVLPITCRGSSNHPFYPLQSLVRDLLIGTAIGGPDAWAALKAALSELKLARLLSVFEALLGFEHHPGLPPLAEDIGTFNLPNRPAGGQPATDDSGGDAPPITEADLRDALCSVMTAAAGQRGGLVLLIDDIEEAGRALRIYLFDLLARVEGQPVLVIATYTLEADDEVRALFVRDRRTLDTLSREETMALAVGALGANSLSDNLAEYLWERSKGFPLSAALLLEWLAPTEALHLTLGEKRATLTEVLTRHPLREVIGHVVKRMPPDQSTVLRNSSVLGNGWRRAAPVALAGLVEEHLFERQLTALSEGGWLVRSSSGPDAVYVFRNSLTLIAIYESIPEQQRQVLHKRAGDYYYTASLTGQKVRASQSSYHYSRAGHVQESLAPVELALLKTRDTGDRPRLIGLYRDAIRIASADPGQDEKRLDFIEALGDLYAEGGDYANATRVYGEGMSPNLNRFSLPSRMGLALLAVDPARAAHVLGQFASRIPPTYQEDLRWRVEAGLVWAMALIGQSYEMMRRSRDSLAVLNSLSGFGFARSLVRGTLGMALFYQGEHAEAYPHLESARSGWLARGDNDGVALIDKVLAVTSREEITATWLRLALHPLLNRKL